MRNLGLKLVSLKLLIVVSLLNISVALAADNSASVPPSKMVINITENVKKIIADNKSEPEAELDKKLESEIAPAFNFAEMAKRCLGKNWGTATAAEQDKFVELFAKLLSRTYLNKIKRNAETSSTKISKEVIQGQSSLLKTVISYSGETATVDYRLHLEDGSWRIYDVIIENIGLVTNYRNEFASIVRKDKMAGLITQLEKKVNNPNTLKDEEA